MATEVNFLQSRKEVFLSLSVTALIDDVNGLGLICSSGRLFVTRAQTIAARLAKALKS